MAMAVKSIPPLTAKQRREAARQSLREEILAASREIIATEGFDALTMRHLAERIGYSAASLYLHFKNREEIAREVSRVGYAELLATLQQAVAPHAKDAIARLRAVARAYIEFGLENPQTYSLIFMEDRTYIAVTNAEKEEGDPGTKAYELLVETAARLIAAGLKPQKVGRPARAVTPTELAESIWAALHGVVSLKLTCPEFPTAPAALMTGVLVETLVAGLSSLRR